MDAGDEWQGQSKDIFQPVMILGHKAAAFSVDHPVALSHVGLYVLCRDALVTFFLFYADYNN